jgi:hypothetical protein
VNGDEYDDRLLWFRMHELGLRPGEETVRLEGTTSDGVAFEAEVAVEVARRGNGIAGGKGAATPTAAGAEASGQPAVLGILSASMGAGRVELRLSLPSSELASVEVFDVTGRRVAAEEIQPGGGSHQVALTIPGQVGHGVYWIRLRQGSEVATKRTVHLP